MPSLCQVGVEWRGVVWRFAKARSSALALAALWLLAGNCLASGPLVVLPHRGASALPIRRAAATDYDCTRRFDMVMVEPQGRGPQGYRYRIVLDSATQGAESSLDLAAGEDGLLVTARDVDGIGHDLDLIIKSANSLAPIGIWINDHHGGFIKVDAGVYAPSIWADGPFLLSVNPPDALHGALLVWHQSYNQPVTQRCPGERWTLHALVEPADLHAPSRLTADAQHTRGPPRLSL